MVGRFLSRLSDGDESRARLIPSLVLRAYPPWYNLILDVIASVLFAPLRSHVFFVALRSSLLRTMLVWVPYCQHGMDDIPFYSCDLLSASMLSPFVLCTDGKELSRGENCGKKQRLSSIPSVLLKCHSILENARGSSLHACCCARACWCLCACVERDNKGVRPMASVVPVPVPVCTVPLATDHVRSIGSRRRLSLGSVPVSSRAALEDLVHAMWPTMLASVEKGVRGRGTTRRMSDPRPTPSITPAYTPTILGE